MRIVLGRRPREEENEISENVADFSVIVERMEAQNKLLEEIKGELLKSNDFDVKEKEENLAKEQKKTNGELSTDEKILEVLNSYVSSAAESDKKISDQIANFSEVLGSSNVLLEGSGEELKKIVQYHQDSSKQAETQNNLFVTYSVYIIPCFIGFYLLYKFFKQFI